MDMKAALKAHMAKKGAKVHPDPPHHCPTTAFLTGHRHTGQPPGRRLPPRVGHHTTQRLGAALRTYHLTGHGLDSF